MDSDSNFSQDFLNLIKVHAEFERVKEILDGSLLYHIADKSGATLLHYSARYNNEHLAKYLLDKGCDVDMQDSMGITPLMYAVAGKHEAVAKILLSADADIFKLNNLKKTSLHMMRVTNNGECSINQLLLQELRKKCSTSEEIAKKLVSIGCPLHLVVLLKDAEIIECMLKPGRPVDEAHPITKQTGLHVAVRWGDLKSVNVLLDYGADVNALDFANANPLYYLYKIESQQNVVEKIEILKVLHNGGASMTSCLKNGVFSAYHVLVKGNREAIRILIDSGLDFKAKDNQRDKNVLHYLSMNPDWNLIDELCRNVQKFDVNVCDKLGEPPIFAASDSEGKIYMICDYSQRIDRIDSAIDAQYIIDGTRPLRASNSLSRRRYCHNLLIGSYKNETSYEEMKNNAAVVICKFFKNRIDRTHLVIDKIIDYLDDRSLRRLSSIMAT